MHFLGLDQSLARPGLAILDGAGRVVRADHLSVSAGLRGARRLAAIVAFVEDAMRAAGADAWRGAIEGPSLKSTHREFDLGEVSGALRAAAWRGFALDLVVVAPAQLKKFATGNAFATKGDVVHGVKSAWDVDLPDADEADAYVLARVAYALHTGCAARRCQAEVVRALTHPSPPRRARPARVATSRNL